MIEKFNFYDVYGYLLPGAAFLAILWLPFGLVKGAWPPSDWSSALIAAALAYIVGHLLQNVATNAIPSQRKAKVELAKVNPPALPNMPNPGKSGTPNPANSQPALGRYPSDYFLDPTDPELPKAVKDKVAELVKTQFGLNLEVDKSGDQPAQGSNTTIDKVRNNAFLLARQVLIQGKAVSYAEQFQGMYSVTRGLFAVFGLAFTYWLGWFLSAERNRWVVRSAIIVLAAAVFALIIISFINKKISEKKIPDKYKHGFEVGYAWCLAIMFLAAGYIAGVRYQVTWSNGTLLVFLAVCALLGSFRFKGAYDYFAGRFASTVWRDFLAYNVKAKDTPGPSK